MKRIFGPKLFSACRRYSVIHENVSCLCANDILVDDMLQRFIDVRNETENLTQNLEPEDQVVQTMPDVSPTKWHLAHVTWFWETFVLKNEPYHPKYNYLFNSYYESVGKRYARPERGFLSRPTVEEILHYRKHITKRMIDLIKSGSYDENLIPIMELGINHEQQHQELILMDIKHVFSMNPLNPVFHADKFATHRNLKPIRMKSYEGGLISIGHEGKGFSFDNELPRHKVYLQPFELGDRLVTCGEYMQFMQDGGYIRPEFWLSDGWTTVQKEGWNAPLYWRKDGEGWKIFTLNGEKDINPSEPVVHVSFYEADAFAKWAGARLPTEAEWEFASKEVPIEGNLSPKRHYHPQPLSNDSTSLQQMIGDVWEWTMSPYTPYPGFQPAKGEVGEYNGKFMCSQMVLRGGCAATPGNHIRKTYRNFFPPHSRWCFGGIRLAK